MFTKIIIENILGINNKIELDLMATPKKKEKKDTIVEIETNVNVNKVNGIIGANASGKSSIIHSLLELRVFLAQYEIVENAKKKKFTNGRTVFIHQVGIDDTGQPTYLVHDVINNHKTSWS